MRLKRDDNVLVIKGKDRGKLGRVTQTIPQESKVLVEGVNSVMRHTKPSGTVRQAGIIQKELPVPAANVALICTHCSKPTRIAKRTLADGSKARVCQKCEEVIE